jgi:HEAT repeat protein
MSATTKFLAIAIVGVAVVGGAWLVLGGGGVSTDNGPVERDQRAAASRAAPKLYGHGDALGTDEPEVAVPEGVDTRHLAMREPRRVQRMARPDRPAAATRDSGALRRMPAQAGEAGAPPAEETFESVKHTALSDPNPDERVRAIESLSFYDDESAAVGVLSVALSDPDADVRMAALDELGVISDDPPLPLLETALRDGDPEIRTSALRMLSDSEDEARWPLIKSALADPDEDVRDEAKDIIDTEADTPETGSDSAQ